jgi:hypothetical protein
LLNTGGAHNEVPGTLMEDDTEQEPKVIAGVPLN